MRENTKPVPIPKPDQETPDSSGAKMRNRHYSYAPGTQQQGSMSKDIWIKIITWATPIVFAAGALYYSIGSMADRVKGVEGALSKVKDAQGEVRTEQKVLNVQMNAMREEQSRAKIKIDQVDEKLDGQKDDLTAIKAKLGIRRRR